MWKAEQDLLKRTAMKILMAVKRTEKIGTEKTRARADAANISEEIREVIWILLGHIVRKKGVDVVMKTW